MFHLLDEALADHLKADMPLDPSIEVTFARPDREWSAGLTRPTLSLYLWDVRKDSSRSTGGVEQAQKGGVGIRRLALPRAKVVYFASVWAGDERDEHILLGRLLQSVLRTRVLPGETLPAGLVPDGFYIEMSLGRAEGRAASDFWKSVDGTFRPGIEIELSLPVDLGLGVPLGPPTAGVETRTTDTNQPSRTSTRSGRSTARLEESPR